ncbi:MAG TPA: hypothetical protein VNO82_08810 [Solirubrobacteraceae bacterium]|nr:hypothetical protein [Solirubrobacteraceae bacterium]
MARLLGIRLLALDAKLVVAPAEVKGRTRHLAGGAPRRTRAIGAGLSAAERALSEGALSLAGARGMRSTASDGADPS